MAFLVLLLGLIAFGHSYAVASLGDSVSAILLDAWLDHFRVRSEMLGSQYLPIDGFEFNLTQPVFLSNLTYRVRGNNGVMTNFSTISRKGDVMVSKLGDSSARIVTGLSFRNLQITYSDLYTHGLSTDYFKNYGLLFLKVNQNEGILISVNVTLNYFPLSKDIPCTTHIDLNLANTPNIIADLTTPSKFLPLDLTQSEYFRELFAQGAIKHIRGLLNYENICNKILNLI